MTFKTRLLFTLLLCFTLGLAPFAPEPHLLGKAKWIFGGAVGMLAKDWFDFFLHASPWIYLIILLLKKVKQLSEA